MMRKRRTRGFRPSGEGLDDRCLLSGLTPAQVSAAYGLGAISFTSSAGAKVAGDGTGQTIAIVDLYHDPNIQAALDAFDAKYDLPDLALDVIDQAGSQTDDGWSQEESLDVEWAHAIAPGAKIAVVEAAPGTSDDQEFNNLLAALKAAVQVPGVGVVSMSWGYTEFDGEGSYDSAFTTPGVTYVASSGDDGAIQWPATSPDVLAIGGTSLTLSASGGYGSETGWINTGGGLSTLEAEPSYQKSLQSSGDRSTPDAAFVADPQTGVSGYDIPADGAASQGQWGSFGGTSIGAPAWAGILAIADQGRALAGQSSLTGATQTIPMLYGLPSSAFNKVPATPGGGTNAAIGVAGYNTQTGLGSPVGAAIVKALVGDAASPTATPTPTPTATPSPTSTTSVPTGLLPTPKPIRFPTTTPAPTPMPVPVPIGSSTPTPTATTASTPPPAAPPTSPPAASTPASPHRHPRQTRPSRTRPAHPRVAAHHPTARPGAHAAKVRPGRRVVD